MDRKEYHHQYYLTHRDALNAQVRAWRKAHYKSKKQPKMFNSDGIEIKVCKVCKQTKIISDFRLHTKGYSYRRSECKLCEYERMILGAKRFRLNPSGFSFWRLRTISLNARKGVHEEIRVEDLKRKFLNASTCYYCGKKIELNNAHFDHCIPIYHAGPNTVENLVLSCKTCNKLKNNFFQDEFLQAIQNIAEYQNSIKK